MSFLDRVSEDMKAAMKAREAERLSTLRMMKAALKNTEIENRAPLSDPEAMQVLTTLVHQRKDSIEQFTRGNRPELAAKEAAEIVVIEEYMPKSASEEELRRVVDEVFAELASAGSKPGPRDMGVAMKAVQAKLQAGGIRADGRLTSEMVRSRLASQS